MKQVSHERAGRDDSQLLAHHQDAHVCLRMCAEAFGACLLLCKQSGRSCVVRTMAISSADDIPNQLAALLGIKTVRIGKTDKVPPRMSVIDVAIAVTGHDVFCSYARPGCDFCICAQQNMTFRTYLCQTACDSLDSCQKAFYFLVNMMVSA